MHSTETRLWDAIVIGAGPAGSMSSYLLAKKGLKVLLLDKASFPRHKVCGSCLNGAALQTLAQNGLGDLVDKLDAVPLKQFKLYNKQNSLELNLQNSKALSRSAFDQELKNKAVAAGATFLPELQATVVQDKTKSKEDLKAESIVDCCHVIAKTGNEIERLFRSKIVIVADGLAGRSLEKFPEFDAQIDNDSRIGAGTVLHNPNPEYRPGIIYMSVGSGGYVGAVRLEDDRLDIAAAFDLDFVRGTGSPANAAQQIMAEAKMPNLSGLPEANWQGTSALSRSRKKIAGKGIFVVGDASSYAEPLTGEGIAWALLSATALAPIAARAIESWSSQLDQEWTQEHKRLIRTRQSNSAHLARILRIPALTTATVELLKVLPFIAESLIHYMNSPAALTKASTNTALAHYMEGV